MAKYVFAEPILSQYVPLFHREGSDILLTVSTSDEDLRVLGIRKANHRALILERVAKFATEFSGPPRAATTSTTDAGRLDILKAFLGVGCLADYVYTAAVVGLGCATISFDDLAIWGWPLWWPFLRILGLFVSYGIVGLEVNRRFFGLVLHAHPCSSTNTTWANRCSPWFVLGAVVCILQACFFVHSSFGFLDTCGRILVVAVALCIEDPMLVPFQISLMGPTECHCFWRRFREVLQTKGRQQPFFACPTYLCVLCWSGIGVDGASCLPTKPREACIPTGEQYLGAHKIHLG